MRKARDKSSPNRIDDRRNHDGDPFGCLLGGTRRRGRIRDDDIYLAVDEFRRETRKVVPFPVSKSDVERDILLFCIAQLAQALSESLQETYGPWIRQRGREQKPYAAYSRRMLCRAGELSGEFSSTADDERAAVHYSIT